MATKTLQDKIKSLNAGDKVELVLQLSEDLKIDNNRKSLIGYYVRYQGGLHYPDGEVCISNHAFFSSKHKERGYSLPLSTGITHIYIDEIKEIRKLK